jgi:hypothetical protein
MNKKKEITLILMALVATSKEVFADAREVQKVYRDDPVRQDRELDKIAKGAAELVEDVAALIDSLYDEE